MPRVTVIVASGPPVVREALTLALRRLRPNVDVVSVEPDLLEGAVTGLHPDVVVANRVPPAWAGHETAWITLYPEGQLRVVVRTQGECHVSNDLEFDAMLDVIDRAIPVTPFGRQRRGLPRRASSSDQVG